MRAMSRRWWIILPLFAVLCMTSACTEAVLCEDGAHNGHNADVRMGFVWPNDTVPPDSMFIMAVRIINHRKVGMVVATDNLRGHYVYNAPSDVEPWVDPDIPEPEPEPESDPDVIGVVVDPTEPNNGGVDPNDPYPVIPEEEEEEPPVPSEEVQVDHFSLPKGTYNFLTMSSDTLTHVYRNVIEYLDAEGTGLQYGEMFVQYRLFDLEDEEIMVPGKNYQDYNQGFGYILTESPAIFVDFQKQVEVGQNADLKLEFQPHILTQNIDIYFGIEKVLSEGSAFVVDSVLAEVSGIPCKASLFDGHLNLNRTCKMLFRTKLEDANGNPITDTNSNTELRVHGNINVLSILHSADPTNVSGPGILQVAIYTHTEKLDENGVLQKGPARRVQGRMNMYNALMESKVIAYSDDYQYATKNGDHAVVNIESKAVIKATNTTGTGGSGNGGISDWSIYDENEVDEDINGNPIEL